MARTAEPPKGDGAHDGAAPRTGRSDRLSGPAIGLALVLVVLAALITIGPLLHIAVSMGCAVLFGGGING
ncbi:hypothetical protein [Streptomyces justiciae]|uniref:hypothetical protein n=1 Tax=Streptomyces justiciae TaxID=2780140 RepID=UPI00187F105B|nr:hypothetical protein [Streptomyces justiciae]MBE8475871.1 hypothetical protein [Streptomyces justiciae]MCW8382315.1 hypothetical protein [Streptomyces justiciae]